MAVDGIAAKLLGWYDGNARSLPWRTPPGSNVAPDPYRVWLSEIMLQQTTVAAAAPYFERFTTRWPTVEALAAAADAELMAAWAGLGYYARARNLLACARMVVGTYGGRFPDNEAALRTLPGIGGYTSAAIAAIAFGHRAVVVDANVERVTARLFALSDPLPAARAKLHALADSITPDARAGDFAQAMMDLGSQVCTARSPRCLLCPLRQDCAGLASGEPQAFPVKAARKARPVRHGMIFWLEDDGEVLLVRRPAKGLLGGMRALPTGPWGEAAANLEDAPADAAWRIAEDGVRHIFTHFELRLTVALGRLAKDAARPAGEWWPIDAIEAAGLPTVFARAAAVARACPTAREGASQAV